jgi:hypothetical protein
MKLTFSSRLWLAWRVLRGQIVGASWDSRSDTVTFDLIETAALRERIRS